MDTALLRCLVQLQNSFYPGWINMTARRSYMASVTCGGSSINWHQVTSNASSRNCVTQILCRITVSQLLFYSTVTRVIPLFERVTRYRALLLLMRILSNTSCSLQTWLRKLLVPISTKIQQRLFTQRSAAVQYVTSSTTGHLVLRWRFVMGLRRAFEWRAYTGAVAFRSSAEGGDSEVMFRQSVERILLWHVVPGSSL